MTTTAIHTNAIAGETPTLSPFAPASPDDLAKQHELAQFLTPASDTSPLIPLPRRLFSPDSPQPVCDHPLPLPQARDIIRCGEGDMASLFAIPRNEVHLPDAGAGAGSLFTPDSKPIEFEGFINMANSPHLEAAKRRRCPVLIPWNSTGLEAWAADGSSN